MKKFSKSAKAKFGVIGVAVVVASTSAMADGVTLPKAVDVTDVLSWAGIILVGIAAIWPIKKLIALGNKS